MFASCRRSIQTSSYLSRISTVAAAVNSKLDTALHMDSLMQHHANATVTPGVQ